MAPRPAGWRDVCLRIDRERIDRERIDIEREVEGRRSRAQAGGEGARERKARQRVVQAVGRRHEQCHPGNEHAGVVHSPLTRVRKSVTFSLGRTYRSSSTFPALFNTHTRASAERTPLGPTPTISQSTATTCGSRGSREGGWGC